MDKSREKDSKAHIRGPEQKTGLSKSHLPGGLSQFGLMKGSGPHLKVRKDINPGAGTIVPTHTVPLPR